MNAIKSWTTATDAKVAYYEWIRAKLQLIVQEQALAQAEAQAKDARSQFEAGASTRADVLRLESQVATVQLDLERARNTAKNSEETLRRQMHDTSGQSWAIGEDIRQDVPALENIADINTLWTEAEEKRLDLKALAMQVKATEERAKAQKVTNLPTVNGIATFNVAGTIRCSRSSRRSQSGVITGRPACKRRGSRQTFSRTRAKCTAWKPKPAPTTPNVTTRATNCT